MNKYLYEITGDYKDHLKMKQNDTIIHDGNLIGLISYSNNRLLLNLNYGDNTYYLCELKKIGKYVITFPIEKYMSNSSYLYKPLVFNQEEYMDLIEISYIDRELLNNIGEAEKKDFFNILTMEFKLDFKLGIPLDFKKIVNSIVAFSEEENEMEKFINDIFIEDKINVLKLNQNHLENIILFVDFFNNLYEWTPIFKSDSKFYFKLNNEYVFEI